MRERIGREGPLSFYAWMKAALYDPDRGYYCSPQRQKWGRAGDYRTSPERSVLFAATFARYFASLYESLGSPVTWSLIEVGAGNGTFAAGVLDTLRRRFPKVYAATTYVIDELSPESQAQAKKKLAEFRLVAFRQLAELDAVPHGIVFSNELLDAFPVHLVTNQKGELEEYFVCVGSSGDFEWMVAPLSDPALATCIEKMGPEPVAGQIFETSPDIENWLTLVSAKLRDGYLVTVDYGDEASELYDPLVRPGGTLRGFREHKIVDDLLAEPGEHDITSSVNWTFVKKIGARLGLDVVEYLKQDRFLLQAGLLEELELRVNEAEGDAERMSLSTSVREMILPHGMASSFQVLVQRKVM
ncbi:MAG: SAM-dependent methyltransferase [bacterium]